MRLLVLTCAAFFMAFCVSAEAQAQPSNRIGVASAVRAQVTATLASQQRTLATGNPVFQDEVIRTGAASVAQLLFADQTTLSVGPRSEVRLDRFVYNPGQSAGDVAVRFSNGALRFVSGSQQPSSYQINTPVATIGVRGTIVDFLLIDGRLFVILDEGAVQITLESGRVVEITQPGRAVEIFSDGTVSAPFTWRGRYEAGLRSASFPLFGNPFADMEDWDGAITLDDAITRTDELDARAFEDFEDDVGQ